MFFFLIARVNPPNLLEKQKKRHFLKKKHVYFTCVPCTVSSNVIFGSFMILGTTNNYKTKSSRRITSKSKRDIEKIVVCVTVLNSMKNRNLRSNHSNFLSNTFFWTIF